MDQDHRRAEDHEGELRLFQDTLELLILNGAPPGWSDPQQTAGDRAALGDLAVLTGLPAAAALDLAPHADHGARPALATPVLVFHPTPQRLEELRRAHLATRRELASATENWDRSDARRVLSVLAGIGRALRTAGLSGAYSAAARRAAGHRGR